MLAMKRFVCALAYIGYVNSTANVVAHPWGSEQTPSYSEAKLSMDTWK